MSQSNSEPRQPLSPDDALPPVEPPTAGFIVQLFVVPAVIVSIIVALWLMFSWLAHMGDSPDRYIEALRRNNPARWQAASSLADALRRRGNERLKHDAQQAGALAELLSEEIDDTQRAGNQNEIKLRAFLARALGEFRVPDRVLPALIKAATTQRNDDELMVRRAAIEAMAVLASNIGPEAFREQPEALETLLRLSRDESSTIRSVAAYALGVVGGRQAIERLDKMLSDAHPSVRYNAATGLARHGREEAVDVLIEMLDPELVPLRDEPVDVAVQAGRRFQIQNTALRAIRILYQKAPEADTQRVCDAVRRLLAQTAPEERTHVEAKSLLYELEKRQAVAG